MAPSLAALAAAAAAALLATGAGAADPVARPVAGAAAPLAKPAAAAPAPPVRSWSVGRPTFPLASNEEGAAVKFFEGSKPPRGLPKEDLVHAALNLTYVRQPADAPPQPEVEGEGEGGAAGKARPAAQALAAWRANVSDVAPFPVVAPPAIRRQAQRAREAWARAEVQRAASGADDVSGDDVATPTLRPPSLDAPASNATEEGDSSLADGYDYDAVLGLALGFFDAQRSGNLAADFTPTWRGDSFTADAAAAGGGGGRAHNIAGGFHDAGDHLKLNFPLGWSLSNLAFAMTTFPAAFPPNSPAFRSAASTLKWGATYLMRCNLGAGRFVAMVGGEAADHSYWGRPEDARMDRPVLVVDGPGGKPGSDVVGQAVAALASTAVVLKRADPEFAAECVAAARDLYATATTYEGTYSSRLPVGSIYPSSTYLDDLAWAAAWMARATGDAWYTGRARYYFGRALAEHPALASALQNVWSDSLAGAAVLLAADTGGPEFSSFLWRFAEVHLQGAWPRAYTPAGLSYAHQWGSLRVASGAATIVAAFGSLLAPTNPVTARKYACFARGQVRYMLGDTGRSFVVGYGHNPPVRVHHRAASCPPFEPGTAGQDRPHCDGKTAFNSPSPNPNVLAGALAGGPNALDQYEDRRDDYVRNEVAMDYNAAFVGALAATAAAGAADGGETWASCLATFAGSLRPIKRVV